MKNRAEYISDWRKGHSARGKGPKGAKKDLAPMVAAQMRRDNAVILGNAKLGKYYAFILPRQAKGRSGVLEAIRLTKIYAQEQGIDWK